MLNIRLGSSEAPRFCQLASINSKQEYGQLKQYPHSRRDEYKLTNVHDVFTPQRRCHVHSEYVVDDHRDADLWRRSLGKWKDDAA